MTINLPSRDTLNALIRLSRVMLPSLLTILMIFLFLKVYFTVSFCFLNTKVCPLSLISTVLLSASSKSAVTSLAKNAKSISA